MNKINASIWKFPPTPEGYFIGDFIHDLLITYIQDGILIPGMKMPSYMAIINQNKISKNTIIRIYKRLETEGWIEAHEGSGTFVAANFPGYDKIYPATRVVKKLPVKLPLPQTETAREKNYLDDFTIIGLDTLSPHYLPPRLYMNHMDKQSTMYEKFNQLDRFEELQGLDLKAAVLSHLNTKRHFMINIECLEVIIGRLESLQQVFKVLLQPADAIVNTSARDKVLVSLLNACNVNTHYIDPAKGDFIAELEKLLQHSSIKALYLRPQCSYPDSYTLPDQDCAALLRLAKLHQFYIVEEDDYHECWYEHKPYIPLICQDHEGHVIYCGALSVLSMYMQQSRTIVAATEFIALMQLKDITHSPFREALAEQAIIELLHSGKLSEYVKKMQREKCKHMYEARMQLYNSLHQIVDVVEPSAGLSLWLVFRDAETLEGSLSCLKNAGYELLFYPGCTRPGPGVRYLRFGFGTWDLNEATESVKIIYEKFKTDCKTRS